ncbi:hypothetical protein PSOS111911_18195 [Pseudoalteromonas ostreae]
MVIYSIQLSVKNKEIGARYSSLDGVESKGYEIALSILRLAYSDTLKSRATVNREHLHGGV